MNMAKGRIVLDAGHYGYYNQSPADKNYFESVVMWELHLLQKKYLEEYGFEVKTTRADQKKDLDLKSRGLSAKGFELFLSNHTNSTTKGEVDENTDFVTVYHLYPDDTTDIDEKSKILAQMMAPAVAKLMGVKQACIVTPKKSKNDRNGDGVMNDNYLGVLNGARIAEAIAVLMEHSFHTNPKVVAWLLDDKNLDALARLEAAIINEFFDKYILSKKEEPETKEETKTEGVKTVNIELNVLKKGAKGEQVKTLQRLLLALGYDLAQYGVDGSFGGVTDKAVRAFQKAEGLTVDGSVGKKTWTALLK